ncbi:MAG: polyphosphate polymerase domain-containing protein [Anaerolineae bacterium]|nr:polyphosphate polymerase domain-containing protein [Anaerolineae bacterium]
MGLRYELKLICDARWLPQARSWIRLHPSGLGVAYPSRRVNSIYLDTLHMSSFAANLVGVSARYKLRLRWYGEATTGIQTVLELKRKDNMLGDKLQYALPCMLDLNRPWKEIVDTVFTGVPSEWQVWMQTMRHPTLFNHYQREYYVTSDGVVRVTLDFALAVYNQRMTQRPNLRARQPLPGIIVLEIKAGQDQEDRLQEIVSEFPIPRSRNSKYVNGLLAAM